MAVFTKFQMSAVRHLRYVLEVVGQTKKSKSEMIDIFKNSEKSMTSMKSLKATRDV